MKLIEKTIIEFIKRLDELGVIKDELNVMIDKRYRGI